MLEVPKHPEAKLYPSEVVTLALLFAIKGGGMRVFYLWLTRDYLVLFPQVPERTRLARLFTTYTAWTARFMAAPTCWASPTATGLSCFTPCGKVVVPPRSARRARAIIAGLSGASSVLS
jgi:hypothetical protein